MFESSLIESRNHRIPKRKLALVPAALVVHSLALAGVSAAQFWTVEEMSEPHLPIDWVVIERAAPPPIPAPPPPRPPKPPDDADTRRPSAVTQPESVPAEVPDASDVTADNPDEYDDEGVEGSVSTGSSGGRRDGVPGGVGEKQGRSAPEPSGPIVIGGSVVPPVLRVRVDPSYPEPARRLKKQGAVIVHAVLGKDGTITSIRSVTDTVGFGARESTLAAVGQWRYEPAYLNGRPVEVYLTITVAFNLT